MSCSDNNLEQDITAGANSAEESELLSMMKAFNDSILLTKVQTRAIVKPGVWRRTQIIAADCGGAYSGGKAGAWAGAYLGPDGAIAGGLIGGLLGGVCGSYVAWKSLNSESRAASLSPVNIELAKERTINAYATVFEGNNIVSDCTPRIVNVQYPVVNENVTLMGAKHNMILSKLVNDENLSKDGIRHLSESQIKIINSKEFSDSFNSCMETICTNIISSDGMTLNDDDISSKLMNMFYDILIRYPEGLTDIEFLINKYMDAVKNSDEIPEHDKELIYSGLSVAASSSEFWNDNYK